MKALSVKQPWANLIADGRKDIETRRWSTDYRGPLLIVSSKSPNIAPAGFGIAVTNLVDCRPMTRGDEIRAQCATYEGAFAWILADVRVIQPFPVRGQLGIYEVALPTGVLMRTAGTTG